MRAALWIVFAASLAALLAGIAYCWVNRSGHSGFDPFNTVYLFAVVFAIGRFGGFVGDRNVLPARMVAATGLIGMAFGVVVTKLGILKPYQDWIAAGMPDRNPNAGLVLAGFVALSLGVPLLLGWQARGGSKGRDRE